MVPNRTTHLIYIITDSGSVKEDSETYLLPYQTSKMERFKKVVIGWQQLNHFRKISISDVWQGSE